MKLEPSIEPSMGDIAEGPSLAGISRAFELMLRLLDVVVDDELALRIEVSLDITNSLLVK